MTSLQFVDETAVLNGSMGAMQQGPFALDMKRSAAEAGLNDESDSDGSECGEVERFLAGQGQALQHAVQFGGPKPGKKTKGRVKIKMEFIENKLRRYTTFSKRKTGIMKKAYELSTLTGTQVMLLVASETGHVYTFATRKLQPMITSESGKALIQTCLNSPDAPGSTHPGANLSMDQRMNPTGFEETELSYAVTEEEAAAQKPDTPPAAHTNKPTAMVYGSPAHVIMPQLAQAPVASTPSPQAQPQNLTMNSQVQNMGSSSHAVTVTPASTTSSSGKQQTVSMQLPPGGVAALLNPQAGLGAPITLSPLAGGSSSLTAQQALYRLPSSAGGQVISLPASLNAQMSTTTTTSSQALSSQQSLLTGANGNNGSTVMYQTQQGVVYAAAPTSASMSAIPEGYVLNLPQNSLQFQGDTAQNASGQQYITIPVPVSLATNQALLPLLTQAGSDIQQTSGKRK